MDKEALSRGRQPTSRQARAALDAAEHSGAHMPRAARRRTDRMGAKRGAEARPRSLVTDPWGSPFRMLARWVACGYKGATSTPGDLPPGGAGGLPKIQCPGNKALILLGDSVGEWCNGSTTDSDSVCLGSNPGSPAKTQHMP